MARVLERPDIQAVAVVTPATQHADIVRRALNAGKTAVAADPRLRRFDYPALGQYSEF